jgi:hypothetical protein
VPKVIIEKVVTYEGVKVYKKSSLYDTVEDFYYSLYIKNEEGAAQKFVEDKGYSCFRQSRQAVLVYGQEKPVDQDLFAVED